MQAKQTKRRQRAYVAITAGLAILMVASAVLPGLSQQNQQIAPPVEPTVNPVPTFPPPPALNTISLDQTYLHPSGLFTVAQPSGWLPSRDSNNGTHVQITFNNEAAKSVIETYIEKPFEPIESLEALSAHFTADALRTSWRNYLNPTEIGRFIDTENQRVLIDFELTLSRQTYLARHVARLEDGWIEVTRVVTPENARELLLFLVDQLPRTITRVPLFADVPSDEIAWTAYYSPVDGLIIRHPNGWRIVDGGPGDLVSIEGSNGEMLRIETLSGVAIEDEAAATAFVEALRPGIRVVSVSPVTRGAAQGYNVAYQFRTLEGENQNGLAALLNGLDGRLYVANVRASGDPLDLNAEDSATNFLVSALVGTINSFNLAAGSGLPDADAS